MGRINICGPSQSEKNLQKSEADFNQTLQQDYAQTFAANQEILKALNASLAPILAAGPNQQGYSPAELAALNTQAIESNATGVNQAEKAAAQREDAAGGGTSLLPSGVNAQINAEIGTAGEENLSREQLGITQANYAQGRANWQTALSGELATASGFNPLGYASATTSANTSAFNEANAINQQSNQMWSDVLGGVVGIAGSFARGYGQGMGGGGAAQSGGTGYGTLPGYGPDNSSPSGPNPYGYNPGDIGGAGALAGDF